MTDTHTYEQAADLLPIGDAARMLGVSVPTIRRWESEGKIAGTRTLGNQRRFSRNEIERVRTAAPFTRRVSRRSFTSGLGR